MEILLKLIVFALVSVGTWVVYELTADRFMSEAAMERVAVGSEMVTIGAALAAVSTGVGAIFGIDWMNILRTICDACKVVGICT
jgi:hypothetical protein